MRSPRHEATPLAEKVLFRTNGSSIVRKIGLAGDIARELSAPQ